MSKKPTKRTQAVSVPFYSERTFERQVIRANRLAVVEFTADWCAPCRKLAPIIDQLAAEFSGKAKIGKINYDTEKKLIGKYKVTAIPTLLFFKKGKIVKRLQGARSYKELQGQINRAL